MRWFLLAWGAFCLRWILPMFQKFHSIETPLTVWWLGVSHADGMHTKNSEFIEVIAALIVTAGLVGGNFFLFMPLLKDNRIKLPNTSSQSAVGRTADVRWQWPYALHSSDTRLSIISHWVAVSCYSDSREMIDKHGCNCEGFQGSHQA